MDDENTDWIDYADYDHDGDGWIDDIANDGRNHGTGVNQNFFANYIRFARKRF